SVQRFPYRSESSRPFSARASTSLHNKSRNRRPVYDEPWQRRSPPRPALVGGEALPSPKPTPGPRPSGVRLSRYRRTRAARGGRDPDQDHGTPPEQRVDANRDHGCRLEDVAAAAGVREDAPEGRYQR